MADGDNQTIWGESYEKSESAASGGNVSSERYTTSVACVTSDQRTEYVNNTATASTPTPKIDLFADIEDDGCDGEGADVQVN